MEPAPSTVVRTYSQRGPLQQFRFAESTAFSCFRCGESKRSKLITVYGGDWSRRLCHGCYRYLLSVHQIKAGTAADDQRKAERLFKASDGRAESLSAEALRFVATAEHVAGQLEAEPQLEWSPAVIGLCKAVEVEVVRRILQPLRAGGSNEGLSADRGDKDPGRVAAFCIG